MARGQGHRVILEWTAPQRNAQLRISMVVLDAKIGNKPSQKQTTLEQTTPWKRSQPG
jgi:hypothetical protein